MDLKVVIIEDSIRYQEDTLVWELKERFGENNVVFYSKSQEGLDFIQNNLSSNMIVLLDIDFPANEKNGHEVLKEITNSSKLIPVILWSGIDENKETFSDFINNNAFGFISKTSTSEEAMSIIEKALLWFETNVDNAIEDWITRCPEDKEKPAYITSGGKSLSLMQILQEVRSQTVLGKEFVKKFNALTVDLLLRNKEKLK